MTEHADGYFGRTAGTPARAFLVQAVLWNVALFGLIRLSWFDQHFIGALISFQQSVLLWYGASAPPGLVVNSSCSGADVMALCAGVALAYPVAWSRRLIGAALGVTLMLTLNAVRIATLFAVASDRATLDLLHLYVWPVLLTVAAVVYVFLWIRWSERRSVAFDRHWTRFGVATAVALLAYAAVVPWALTSTALVEVGGWTASAGGVMLRSLGATAQETGNVLVTGRGAFIVTQECLFTPVLPLYLAAAFSLPMSRGRRGLLLLFALPVFFALGVARLLALALPPYVTQSPVFLVHGFYQLVTGFVIIVGAAHLALGRDSGRGASMRTAGALAAALVSALVIGPLWEPALLGLASALQTLVPQTLTSLLRTGDQQGALALLPAFQIGLLAGLWFALTGTARLRRFAMALGLLAASQIVLLAGLGVAIDLLGVEPHVLVIRIWAVLVPLVIAGALASVQGTWLGDPSYRRFWQGVGEEFPILTGAASTQYYFENEKRLISEALPSLEGRTLLKTDLWDEAKNTRIMQWAADQGARVYGIDLSEPIVRQAREAFGPRTLRPVVSDVRRLPFGDDSFDAIYSMGTIEHFAETEATVAELARILKPGGRLILGVPNRHDPFLRPLFVAAIHRFGLYGYGYEKSYSRRALRRMIEDAGLDVTIESGILFIPGWLRMLDLWCFTRVRPLAAVTGLLVRPFAWLDGRIRALRRHGYLLASVAVKPGAAPQAGDGEASAGVTWRPAAVGGHGEVAATPHTGVEFVVDARGCDPEALQSLPRLRKLFAEVHEDLSLHSLSPPVWHVFPGHGGVTGMALLSESHLTIHTYPEAGLAAINLYCCRPSVAWDWDRLRALLGATEIEVRQLRRG
jgi:S-adenosylmethionine decarboxylase